MVTKPSIGQTGWGSVLNAALDFLENRGNHVGTQPSTTINDLEERVQDIVGAMLVSGATVTWAYNDTTGTVTATATGGDAELMRDTIGTALVGVNGIQVAPNDNADTIVLDITGLTISQVTNLQTTLDAKVAKTGNETIDGIKTFTSAPVVPLNSFAQNAIIGLLTSLLNREYVIRWNSNNNTWPARPAAVDIPRAKFSSTNVTNAAAPSDPNLQIGDTWETHPDQVV